MATKKVVTKAKAAPVKKAPVKVATKAVILAKAEKKSVVVKKKAASVVPAPKAPPAYKPAIGEVVQIEGRGTSFLGSFEEGGEVLRHFVRGGCYITEPASGSGSEYTAKQATPEDIRSLRQY